LIVMMLPDLQKSLWLNFPDQKTAMH
jgi:hypothetical protein